MVGPLVDVYLTRSISEKLWRGSAQLKFNECLLAAAIRLKNEFRRNQISFEKTRGQ